MAPRIYFVLELDIDNSQLMQDDFSEEPYSAEERFYAAVYSPLSLILESPLHNERMVEATYVNIQDQCFKMNANAVLPHGETSFLAMMAIVAAGLYQNGRVLHPTSNQEMMRTIDNRGLLHFLPTNSRIIGCLCGTSSRSGTQNIRLDNYLATVNDNRPVVFVVGDMVDPSITRYVDDFVTVSEMDVTTATCLSHVMDEAERKWIN